ncbi:hypothetical protein ACLB2K_039978 [Fragaria x ananassa]
MEMVFVKEKVQVEEGQIDHFINEIISFAQMNHKNVIKLLGCCLDIETEAPILIYEVASNGSLFDYIHDRKNGKNSVPYWDILMEIAAESAAGPLTEKSDVYSFVVVLVEILTGEKTIDYYRPESQRIITSHFLLSMESQNGLVQILAPQDKEDNKERVTAVAELAKRCLKLCSAERPTMEEVAGELKTMSDTYITVHVS